MIQFGPALAAAAAFVAPAAAVAQDRVVAPDGALSLEKPAGWYLLPAEESLSNLRSINPESPEYQALIARMPNAPLVTISKVRPGAAAGVIPTLRISYRVQPGASRVGAGAIAEATVQSFRTSFPDAQITMPTTPTAIGGRPAVRLALRYRLVAGDPASDTESVFWVLVGTNYFYSIGISHAATADPRDRAALEAAVQSIRFEPEP